MNAIDSRDVQSLMTRAIVQDIKPEAEGVLTMELVPDGEAEWPAGDAGAHIDVELPNGTVRQYSVINPGEPNKYVISALRAPDSRGGSEYIHDQLSNGSVVRVSRPRNNFPLIADDRPVCLIGGGIGVTPLLAMAQTLAGTDREWRLYYCVRTPAHAGFGRLLDRFGDRVRMHYDSASGSPPDLQSMVGAFDDAHVYCCGPQAMLTAFEQCTAGFPSELVHIERFSPADIPADSSAFTVELVRQGLTLDVPEDKSILDVIEESGVQVESSCRIGICGTCEAAIVEGEADHKDEYLTDDEKKEGRSMMICCSRSKSPVLRLDI